jgi:hypothetical protein
VSTPARASRKPSRLAAWMHALPERLENPVLGRELRGRMRGARSYLVTGGYTLVVIVFVLVTYWGLTNSTQPGALNTLAARVGRGIWTWGCIAQALLVPLMVPAFTCGGITLERERDMLELLLLTRQTPLQICLGKWGSGVGLGLVLVLASVPVLSLSLLLGGVSPGEMLACLAVLATAVLCVGAFGLAASTLTQKTSASTAAVYLTIGFLLVGLPLMDLFLRRASMMTLEGSEAGIVAMLLAGTVIAFPPAVGVAAALYTLRRVRTGAPASRAWWMAVTGLAWAALLLVFYLPGMSELLLQGGVLLLLHPVVVIWLTLEPNPATLPNLWAIAAVTYAGVAGWWFFVAVLRVRRLRSG